MKRSIQPPLMLDLSLSLAVALKPGRRGRGIHRFVRAQASLLDCLAGSSMMQDIPGCQPTAGIFTSVAISRQSSLKPRSGSLILLHAPVVPINDARHVVWWQWRTAISPLCKDWIFNRTRKQPGSGMSRRMQEV